MQRNELIKKQDTILRVLEVQADNALIITCSRKEMPKWVDKSQLTDYEKIAEADFAIWPDFESLSAENRRIAHERYTLIAGILPFAGDKKQRSYLIAKISAEKEISKQTIRKYLCDYLVYQNLSVLAPKQPMMKKSLTQDEKNMRWALNKFYYTKNKNSLATTYTMMLKERYCESSGVLLPEYPTIHQFRYFYRTHKKLQTYHISREGLKKYQRNYRPLLGDSVQQFAPNIGTAMLDATICDIYLVNDSGSLVGRPILTACVDAYSGLCCGYTLSWEGGVYSLRNLMLNVIADKVEWCRKFGITIKQEAWNCSQLPAVLVTDMGTEYKSQNFEQLTELGVQIINLPAFRPEQKGSVEKFFDVIQNLYKRHLKGKGVIEPDFQERGAHDYRKDACLTLYEFEKILLHCVIYYNNQRILKNFPYTETMISDNIQPYASAIWNYGMLQVGANLISIKKETLVYTLLPRTRGIFSRNGLRVNKLRYRNDAYTEQYLQGGTVTVAYNPDDVSEVWLLDEGQYIRFSLIESRFAGKSLQDIQKLKSEQNSLVKGAMENNLQAQLQLADHIETIAGSALMCGDVNLKEIRNTRSKERIRTYVNVKGGGVHV